MSVPTDYDDANYLTERTPRFRKVLYPSIAREPLNASASSCFGVRSAAWTRHYLKEWKEVKCQGSLISEQSDLNPIEC